MVASKDAAVAEVWVVNNVPNFSLGFWFGRRLILDSQDTPPRRTPRSTQRARDGNGGGAVVVVVVVVVVIVVVPAKFQNGITF